MTEDEGIEASLEVLRGRYASTEKGRFGSPELTNARRRAERLAGMSPAQRRRAGPPKVQVNFRATAETKALINELKERLQLKSEADVIALAIETLARTSAEKKK